MSPVDEWRVLYVEERARSWRLLHLCFLLAGALVGLTVVFVVVLAVWL